MRILLVTLHDNLEMALAAVLNPANEYCAIVTDEIEPAKKILEKFRLPQDLIYPLYELKECIENLYYDYCFLLSDSRIADGVLPTHIKNYGLPTNKFIHFCLTNNHENHLLLDRALRYYELHVQEFEMFSTGMSYVRDCFYNKQIKYKLFNFGRGGEDLYYDYQIAKRVLTPKTGGGGKICYALIGLAPYSFHFDQSKAYGNYPLSQYYIAFKDLHNFKMHKGNFADLFNKGFLDLRLSLENFDVDNVYNTPLTTSPMNYHERIRARELFDAWKNKIYPETLEENIKILDDYLSLCIKNKVRPIIFTTPFTEGHMKYFNKQKLNEFYYLVQKAIKKFSDTAFFDGLSLSHLFDGSDFKSNDHLNLRGAMKFSAMFNSVIERLEK